MQGAHASKEGRLVNLQVECLSVASQPHPGDEQDSPGKYRVADLSLDGGDAYILAHELLGLHPFDGSLLKTLLQDQAIPSEGGRHRFCVPACVMVHEDRSQVYSKALGRVVSYSEPLLRMHHDEACIYERARRRSPNNQVDRIQEEAKQ